MKAKKMVTNIKIHEDLVPGIKRILDEVSTNRRFLTIGSIWTIDRCIQFRFINNPKHSRSDRMLIIIIYL